MKVLMDKEAVSHFVHIATAQYGDRRRYYFLPGRRVILVLRNGLDIEKVAGRTVDAVAGRERTPEGFTDHPGELHLKITVYRVVGGRYDKKLKALIREWEK